MRVGGCPAGSSRVERLDPHALPLRFSASDTAADGRVREVELHRERVIVRRSLDGMRMALNLPLSAFAGVALRMARGEETMAPAVAVVLAHKDPGLVLPLFVSAEPDEAFAEWSTWGQVLGLPLLVTEPDGSLRNPFARMGGVRLERPRPRRRRHSALKRRRPSILMRRAPGSFTAMAPVHRGEREIIARD